MKKLPSNWILAWVVVASSAVAQQGASTLARLTQHADVIVRARALASHPHGAELAHAQFRVQATLHGDVGAEVLTLSEPARRACGRALHGVVPGVSYVAFLRQSADGSLSLFAGGSRSLIRNEPGLEVHVAALLATPQPGIAQLVAGLDSASARVRTDSELAMATAADLTTATATQRTRIVAQVLAGLDDVDRETPSLLITAARLQAPPLVAPLIETYLSGNRPAIDRPLGRCIAALDPSSVASVLATLAPGVVPANHSRLLALVQDLVAESAAVPLQHLLTHGSTATRLRAGSTWLRLGLDTRTLRDQLTTADFDSCCALGLRPPQLRSVRRIR